MCDGEIPGTVGRNTLWPCSFIVKLKPFYKTVCFVMTSFWSNPTGSTESTKPLSGLVLSKTLYYYRVFGFVPPSHNKMQPNHK
jgi:hypothetical protein